MSYTKTSWEDTTLRSARLMNHMESQWTAISADADAHNHNARYYTKTLADTTFYSTSYYTGFDADMVDGEHLAGLVSAVLPIGAIMIWSGTDGNVPTGWYVCDGNAHNGYTTPNLIERFVIGAGGAYSVNASGGPATWNGTITPTGSVTIGDHALITAELPSHTHPYAEQYSPINNYRSTNGGTCYTSVASTTALIGEQSSGNGTHGHTGSTATIGAIDPRPVYYSLYYIMKCE